MILVPKGIFYLLLFCSLMIIFLPPSFHLDPVFLPSFNHSFLPSFLPPSPVPFLFPFFFHSFIPSFYIHNFLSSLLSFPLPPFLIYIFIMFFLLLLPPTHFSELMSASFHSGQITSFCFLLSCAPTTLAAMEAALKKENNKTITN